MKNILSTLAVVLLLGGCQAAGPHTKALTSLVNGGNMELPENMVRTNLTGWSAFGERHVTKTVGASYTAHYVNNVTNDSELAPYRYLHINTSLLEGPLLWKSAGSVPHRLVAFIPDHIGQVMREDIVEFRSLKFWGANENFLKDGEAQIVIRVLCRKADPAYDKCLNDAPNWHGVKGTGHTGTEFLANAKDYGFSFSKVYDEKGKLIKPLPKEDRVP